MVAPKIDEALLEYCETDVQRRAVESVLEHGSCAKAAEALGQGRRAVEQTVMRVRMKAERHGYSPDFQINRPVPKMLKMSGLSDMRENELGKPVWYKFSADHIAMAEQLEE